MTGYSCFSTTAIDIIFKLSFKIAWWWDVYNYVQRTTIGMNWLIYIYISKWLKYLHDADIIFYIYIYIIQEM